MKKDILFKLSIIIAALSISVCGCQKVEVDGATVETDRTDLVSSQAPSEDNGGDIYCTLEYPEELKEDLIVEQIEENGVISRVFIAKLGDTQFKLFSVNFGEASVGELYGYITSGDDEIPVYIECFSLPEDNTLTDLQIQTYYEMMDGINTVVRSIESAEGFSAG